MREGPEYAFPMITHILGVSKFKCLGDLRAGYLVVLPEVVRKFMVYLGI
jgi:hypothetical protein